MKRTKTRSEVTISPKGSYIFKEDPTEYIPPLDELMVHVMSIRLPDEHSTRFTIKISFFDQLLLTGVVRSIGARDVGKEKALITGSMNYDPSDYEKMCMFADCPLVVHIQPIKEVEQTRASQSLISNKSGSFEKSVPEISCCNVDILPLFIDLDKMCVRKRMEPMFEPKALLRKSWDNLPLVTLELSVKRNSLNAKHHVMLKKANYMKFTVVASYNMIEPYNNEFVYTAATKMPLCNETNTTVMTFDQGYSFPKNFRDKCFYPKWENLRHNDDAFTRGDEKVLYDLDHLQNENNIDLRYYMNNFRHCYTTVWGSFHRTLILQKSQWLYDHLRSYKWPFEIHMVGEQKSLEFMAHFNLFKLLYPGESYVCLAVPLNWINSQAMAQQCGCELLLSSADNAPSTSGSGQKPTSKTANSKESGALSTSTDTESVFFRSTGADGNTAFVIVEVKLARPLKKPAIPPFISHSEIAEMLTGVEAGVNRRECIGRGQLDREWLSTLKTAVASLNKVPHYGMTEFCNFNRQLSETRTRVELLTSFTNDAAMYVNNNFVVQDFLRSDEIFEEMLLMSHACLMRITCQMLVEVNTLTIDPTLRAARHARQMQDVAHAKLLYLQLVIKKSRDADYWRELSTCLMDINRDWGDVCLTKSLQLNFRHPITLLAKGCMVYDSDPDAAEVFFGAILALYPFWTAGWVVISSYYFEQQLYYMADAIKDNMKKTKSAGLVQYDQIAQPRCWGHELGDWWESTPLLPGMSVYYDAADLLLRLRAFTLADVCVARALAEAGESTAYYHLVTLCCRLRGDIDQAICHATKGLEKFGEIGYLRALEAECLHKNNVFELAAASFEKSGCSVGAYSTLLGLPTKEPQRVRSTLVDLIRRQPNAYAWMALADDWMKRAAMGEGGDGDVTDEQTSAKVCAAACAVQALKWDRLAGRAWALLSALVTPSARRMYCRDMAKICGYEFDDNKRKFNSPSEQSLCHRLGTALRECRCVKCDSIKL
ncbi:uncharacterized protein LOC106132275 [Amyelois transitella]|uniref:uncharacterized protein LOC106132275 n=1 Tax=Amyelois transitella TaxID=680683 RepID=UPI00298FF6DF|nr:uncharacterized protein LOC106132275 [Amyelois transitella]